MKRKVNVSDVQMGMYISELDKPWLGSPFLFQGFKLEDDEDLDKLKDYCEYVIVDDEQTDDGGGDDQTIRLSMRASPDGKTKITREEWARKAEDERRLTFQQSMREALDLRDRTKGYVEQLFQDVRLGVSVNTEQAKVLVSEIVAKVAEDVDTMLWMTQLKNAHEYTQQHCMNVSVLAVAFGAHLGYPDEQLQIIGLGALLHDIGKMKVPKEILDKPGKLTPEEFEIMKRHPAEGYELMKESGQVPAGALQIIRFHHERISGKGYPDGLAGDQISTAVLLSAICDVYDAITSDRVYHHGIPAHEGLNAMYQLAPNDFGKELMQEFIRCIGIYPVGSMVELKSGGVGIVLTNDPSNKLRPVVMLLRDPKGKEYLPRRYVSLSVQDELDKTGKWTVSRIVDPRNYGINMQQLASQEVLDGGSQVVHI
ncbi:MAG: HD-GYP domain-containing protein [Gammaproteobacteria bacterium]